MYAGIAHEMCFRPHTVPASVCTVAERSERISTIPQQGNTRTRGKNHVLLFHQCHIATVRKSELIYICVSAASRRERLDKNHHGLKRSPSRVLNLAILSVFLKNLEHFIINIAMFGVTCCSVSLPIKCLMMRGKLRLS